MFISLFAEDNMWIVILYVCVSQACVFIDSPPLSSEESCKVTLAKSMAMLEAEKNVVAYDGDCVYIQMRQV
jgi:hypothetical protein